MLIVLAAMMTGVPSVLAMIHLAMIHLAVIHLAMIDLAVICRVATVFVERRNC
jgi:hypothetical protein